MPVGAIIIEPVQKLGGAVSFILRAQVEAQGQTFFAGTPVNIRASDGGVIAWPGTGVGQTLAGFAAEMAANLPSTGYGAPKGFTPVLGPGSLIGSYVANPNQSLARITPPGVPMSDGRIRFWTPRPGTVFVGKLGSGGNPIATAQTQVGTNAGLTIDTNNYWYVDASKTTTGTNACVTIVGLDPRDMPGTIGGRVWFTVLDEARQIES